MLAPLWFLIRVLLAHWPSSLARNEGREQVTTGNRAVLQSITVHQKDYTQNTVSCLVLC